MIDDATDKLLFDPEFKFTTKTELVGRILRLQEEIKSLRVEARNQALEIRSMKDDK